MSDLDYSKIIVTVDDMLAISYCARGSRAFARKYGLDMRKFIEQGITAKELLDTGDSLAELAVNNAIKRLGLDG